MALDPGMLRERVTIQQEVRTGDGAGGSTRAWTTLAEVWAMVRTVRAAEQGEGGALVGTALLRFTIRRRTDVTAAMRLLWNGRTFNIRSCPDLGSGAEWLAIEAEEGVAV